MPACTPPHPEPSPWAPGKALPPFRPWKLRKLWLHGVVCNHQTPFPATRSCRLVLLHLPPGHCSGRTWGCGEETGHREGGKWHEPILRQVELLCGGFCPSPTPRCCPTYLRLTNAQVRGLWRDVDLGSNPARTCKHGQSHHPLNRSLRMLTL